MNLNKGIFLKTLLFIVSLYSFLGLIAPSALAGEGLFSRPYTTETVPQGHYEIEQMVRNRTGRSFGTYSAFDFRSEFEYGITNNFQGAFYLNSEFLNAHNAPDDNDPAGDQPGGFTRKSFFIQGVSFEFIYRVLSPISDPIGLAFYIEPSIDFRDIHNGVHEYHSFENEFRILLQKNFFDDTLILVYNLVAEIEFFRYQGDNTLWQGEFDWNNELGATYRFMENWFGGLEVRNHNESGNFYTHDHSVFWGGPVIHYGGPKFWATLGVMYELSGNPDGYDSNGSYLGSGKFLHSHELWETTFKIAFPF